MKLLFHNSVDSNLLIIILVITAVIIQVMDKSFGNTFSLSLGNIFPRGDILVFGLMVLFSITVQSFLIKKTGISFKLRTYKSKLGKVVGLITISLQYLSDGILILILFQTIFSSQYNVNLLAAVVGINLLTSSILLAVLSSRFLHTFRNSRSIVTLAYTVAIAVLSLNGVIMFMYDNSYLQASPDYVTSQYDPWTAFSPTAPIDIVSAYQIMSIISFVAPWIATIFLTNHYASKTKAKYCIMISLPIIYFASVYFLSFLAQIHLLEQLGIQDNPLYSYVYNLFLNTVGLAGGIMFGFAFFLLSKTIVHTQLKKSMGMIGTGLVLLFGADASSLIIMTLYPPWGIISTTFLITGAYCLITGLDSAALYLAADSSLRRIISSSHHKGYDILKTLGSSELEDVVISRIKDINKRVSDEVKSDNLLYTSFEPGDVQNYIEEVLMEVRRKNQKPLEKDKD